MAVEVSENWLPWLKSVSATKLPLAAPPALIAVTRLPGGGGVGVPVGVAVGVTGVGVGVTGVGVGVGVGVPPLPPGFQISMPLIKGLSAPPCVKAITIWPFPLAGTVNCFCKAE